MLIKHNELTQPPVLTAASVT